MLVISIKRGKKMLQVTLFSDSFTRIHDLYKVFKITDILIQSTVTLVSNVLC